VTTDHPANARMTATLSRARESGAVGSDHSSDLTRNEGEPLMFSRLFSRTTEVQAHCDLPCGVYDPAQARLEAESVLATVKKYNDSTDEAFRTRAILVKEQRSELVKHHLWVLWTDYFKAPHFEKYPQLHGLFNEATKLAGAGGTKGSMDPAVAEQLLAKIDEIAKIFWETKA
jgi:nickel superoxide dismutase